MTDFDAYRAAFSAINSALGLTDEEKKQASQLGFTSAVLAAREKRTIFQAARAGVARTLITAASKQQFPDRIDWESFTPAVANLDDHAAFIEAETILETGALSAFSPLMRHVGGAE